jgi:S-formylglutathione hydrolase FrmB
VSLTSFAFMACVTAAAIATLGVSIATTPRRSAAGAVAGAAGVSCALLVWYRVTDPLHTGFPPSFVLWTSTPIFAGLLAMATWRRSSWRTRILRIATAGVCVLFAAATINVHYAYIPSVEALMGHTARDLASPATAARIRRHAATTGILPTHGVVLSLDVPAPHSHFRARAPFVYLPPAWFGDPRPRLPVLVLIAGSPGTPADWTRSAGADVLLDEVAAAHRGVAPILVMPDVNGGPFDDTECVDGPRGRAESYLLDDLRPFIVDHYGTLDTPGSWEIAGLSEGGTCAITLTLRHPDVFSTFADFGGQLFPTVGGDDLHALFGGSTGELAAHQPLRLLRHAHDTWLGGWFESGRSDFGSSLAARRLASNVAAAGGSACIVSRDGIHNFTFWRGALRHALPWLLTRLGLDAADAASQCIAAGGTVATATDTSLPPLHHHRRFYPSSPVSPGPRWQLG